jgi:hypothetical protein
MIRKLNICLTLSVFALLLVSCHKNNTEKEKSFREIFVSIEMNKQIQLLPPDDEPTYKAGNMIHLFLDNKSDNEIQFPNDFGIRIFYYSSAENTWIEIQNLVNYHPDEDIVMSPNNIIIPSSEFITVNPALSQSDDINEIRVVVIGSIKNEGESYTRQVGSFIDIDVDQ